MVSAQPGTWRRALSKSPTLTRPQRSRSGSGPRSQARSDLQDRTGQPDRAAPTGKGGLKPGIAQAQPRHLRWGAEPRAAALPGPPSDASPVGLSWVCLGKHHGGRKTVGASSVRRPGRLHQGVRALRRRGGGAERRQSRCQGCVRHSSPPSVISTPTSQTQGEKPALMIPLIC